MAGVDDHGSADFHYYTWVDQFGTLGLGPNVPIATGSTSDSLLAFLPNEEEYVVMRVPYPLGFYSRSLDGRIDDPVATGSTSDSLLAFLPNEEEYVVMRVPYPLGFYSRSLDGRIDDPDGGWKGPRRMGHYGTTAAWHIEGGKGTKGSLIKFQVRPDPLAH